VVAIRDLGKFGEREGKPVVHELSPPTGIESWFSW
jgi:hypothetical protein